MSIIRNILNSTVKLINNSVPTTGSNTFVGTQTMSGSILPAIDNTYDLGSVTYQWRDIYVSSGSLYIDGTKVLGSTNQELQITTDEGQSIKILEAGSDNIILQTADGDVELKSSGGGDILLDPTAGLISVKGTLQIQDGQKITSSGGNNVVFGNNVTITGSIETTGNINGINLTTFSSSLDSRILTEKGRVDAILSAADADKDTFVEIVSLINSVDTTNDGTFASFYTASINRLSNIESVTGSYETIGRGIVSGSSQITFSSISSLPTLVSGSSQVDVMSTTNIARLATTGSNTFVGNQTISGSQYNRSATAAWNSSFENTDGTESVGVYLSHGNGYGIAIDSSENDTKYIFKAMAGTGNGGGRGTVPVIFAQNNGSVGFNTSSPDANYKIDLNGNIKISGVHFVNFGGYTYYNSRYNNGTNNGQIFVNNGTGQNLVLGETASNEYTFGPGSAGQAPSATTLKLNTSTHAVTVGGTFTENSSIRYKENVETIKYGLDKVLQMRGVTYNKKDNGVKEVGVIAEEIYDVLPEVVLKNEEGEIDSVSYGRIVATLIEAIKEQQKQIEELKSLIK